MSNCLQIVCIKPEGVPLPGTQFDALILMDHIANFWDYTPQHHRRHNSGMRNRRGRSHETICVGVSRVFDCSLPILNLASNKVVNFRYRNLLSTSIHLFAASIVLLMGLSGSIPLPVTSNTLVLISTAWLRETINDVTMSMRQDGSWNYTT